ncbi:hypothetical protein [Alkalicoccobacillus murimartini]|uniref:Uncharacterized protein n=1 Tax=Alkalicoccobacillus murimartini TaxID=171685 RepID=A0ABT9YDX3_9BACI|nr:hypothetical protein [Alkalicoccobacillus murimartini]MDQ0205741.1 hypothetical protein [Alkalicoccobacillus murimartini]
MSTPVRLSMPIAFLIENCRTSGLPDQELISLIKSRDFQAIAHCVNEPNMDFNDRIQTAEDLNESWEKALLEGYQFKFLHMNGVKKLLKLRYKKLENIDYKQTDFVISELVLTSDQRIELANLIQSRWNVFSENNESSVSIQSKF